MVGQRRNNCGAAANSGGKAAEQSFAVLRARMLSVMVGWRGGKNTNVSIGALVDQTLGTAPADTLQP